MLTPPASAAMNPLSTGIYLLKANLPQRGFSVRPVLRAPIDGIVRRKFRRPNQFTSAQYGEFYHLSELGESTPL